MKKSLLGLFGMLGLVSVLAASGCGSSSGGSNSSAALASCNAYCDAYIAKACADPIFTSLADCKSSECVDTSAASAGCNNTVKAYYDCRTTQADLCADDGCNTQATAILSACQ
jgi:hypothetical protein